MALFDPLPSLEDIAWAVSFAAAGRATLLLRATREALTLRRLLWVLLWEAPISVAMGLIGLGLAQWAGLTGGGAAVTIALLARLGPDFLDPLLEALVPALKRAKP
ncbi:MAG: phage holin family protein [Gammaproteobacteria bacterium]